MQLKGIPYSKAIRLCRGNGMDILKLCSSTQSEMGEFIRERLLLLIVLWVYTLLTFIHMHEV